MPFFYGTPILPEGFLFPDDYVAIARQGTKLEPWMLLCDDMAMSLLYYGTLLKKFPEKNLIPFAIASDKTGVFNEGWVVLACFDGDDKSNNPKVLIYDYATPKISPTNNKIFSSFAEWLESARKDSLEYSTHGI